MNETKKYINQSNIVTRTNKMKRIFVVLFLCLFFISFTSADVSIGTVKQGTSIELTQTCSNCTYVNLTSLLSPENSYLLLGQYEMTKNGSNFNYTLGETETNIIGSYVYTTCGDLNGVNTCQSVSFEVTPSGREFTTGTAIIYVMLFVILLFMFVGGAFVINKLPASNARDEEGRLMSISWLKYLRGAGWFVEYILFIAIMYIASNIAFAFLSEELFANIFFAIYHMAFRLAPLVVIIWIAWMFVKIFQDKKFWGMMQRGIFPYEV